ncbi:hypothetical protein F442_19049 [Phytophthora nicotianae P10297]|uniref:NPP1-like protein n=1 Tax=Phytophthora nicotianae P10297 TaxID=1317064 RepID=W2YAS4_PHYNI|nr:hypothetical protein F442_19049 [Phytophthora nicotianae P10297]
MDRVSASVLYFVLLSAVSPTTISHDSVQPFVQPDPVTISEKTAVKFKPQLHVEKGCVPFPAVNAAGEITEGLKGWIWSEDCSVAPLGSQMYGRSTWFQDKWAMVYAWYFPTGFAAGGAEIRHYWSSMVMWIDNPALETPKILGASLSQQLLEPRGYLLGFLTPQRKDPYDKYISIPPVSFVGAQPVSSRRISRWRVEYTYSGGSNVSTKVSHRYANKGDWLALVFSAREGQYHDLIMWDQLTDEARAALNSVDFGESKVPFNDQNFQSTLEKAYPF